MRFILPRKLTMLSILNKYKHINKLNFNKPVVANEYTGFYSSWGKALQQTTGYDNKEIFKKVKRAALAVTKGKARFERDSVLFYDRIYDWPLLAILLKISAENNDQLNIADFGGSLGSTYFQHRDFLSGLKEIRWNIIEQKHFVDFGIKHLKSPNLYFYYDLDNCFKDTKPSVFLASGVIEYVKDPLALIDHIIKLKIPNIVFDLTPYIDTSDHKILIQKVSPIIYDASYPIWAFNYQKFIDLFKKDYNFEISFPSYIHSDITVSNHIITWKGIYFTKRR